MKPIEGSISVYPGQQVKTLARLVDSNGSLLDADDLSAITLQVFEKGATEAAVIGPVSATLVAIVTSAATDTLTTVGGWTADEKGSNFSHTFDIASFLTGGRSYRMEYRIATASIGDLFIIVNLQVLPTGQEAS